MIKFILIVLFIKFSLRPSKIMTYEQAVAIVSKYNYGNHPYTIRVIPATLFITSIPVIIPVYYVKEDKYHTPLYNIDDAITHGEKIIQKKMSKT